MSKFSNLTLSTVCSFCFWTKRSIFLLCSLEKRCEQNKGIRYNSFTGCQPIPSHNSKCWFWTIKPQWPGSKPPERLYLVLCLGFQIIRGGLSLTTTTLAYTFDDTKRGLICYCSQAVELPLTGSESGLFFAILLWGAKNPFSSGRPFLSDWLHRRMWLKIGLFLFIYLNSICLNNVTYLGSSWGERQCVDILDQPTNRSSVCRMVFQQLKGLLLRNWTGLKHFSFRFCSSSFNGSVFLTTRAKWEVDFTLLGYSCY